LESDQSHNRGNRATAAACMQFGILLLQFGILPLQFSILPLQLGILPLHLGILPLQFGILPLQFGILPRSLINVSPRTTRTTKQNLDPRCTYVYAGKNDGVGQCVQELILANNRLLIKTVRFINRRHLSTAPVDGRRGAVPQFYIL
jgi:hypothetical protein